MRRRADLGAVIVSAFLLVTLGAPRLVSAQANPRGPRSPQEERRRKLLKEVGLEKNDQAPPATLAPPTALEAAAPTPGPPHESGDALSRTPAVQKGAPSFLRVIHPLVVQTCKSCHAAGGAAAATHLLLSGDVSADHAALMRVLDTRAPVTSLVLLKASGQSVHGGGSLWPVRGNAYGRVLKWIQAGARLDVSGQDVGGTAATSIPLPVPVIPRGAASLPAHGGRAAFPVTAAVNVPNAGTEPAAATAAASSAPASSAAPMPTTTDSLAGVDATPEIKAIDFAGQVHPLLMRTCSTCHSVVGPAATTRLVLSGKPHDDYSKIRALVDPEAPAKSVLLVKATGQGHAGGSLLSTDSAGYAVLLAWVTAGATEQPPLPADHIGPVDRGVTPAPPPAPVSGPAAFASQGTNVRVPTTATTDPYGSVGPNLPGGLALNGRFDIAYERRGFSGNPFGGSSANALRSYHHFLFLSRESTDDPFGLSIEMLSLQFWEAHYRWRSKRLPVHVVVAGGKILVPFGADPLMHQSYGGLSGFDQRILPVIWAQEGVAVHLIVPWRDLAITDDLYVVRGYMLKQAGGIINLQSDFSPDDNARLGWGNRLGAAWGSLSAWYSTYYNPLGFGRRLFMQAGDVMLWRIRGIPVLGHFSFAAGLLRADVSGGDDQGSGGPGQDYYHFGSYFQLRYHPTEWMYLQYREGLRTFNNRRGAFVDDTRLTADDGSTHNVGVVARTHGLTAGVYYFINLEKVAEIPNDLLRVSLSYDF